MSDSIKPTFGQRIGMIDASGRSLISAITADEYAEFEQNWIIYVLKDFRYGQAFIDFFKLPNATPLFYFNDEKICRRWIRDNYLQK